MSGIDPLYETYLVDSAATMLVKFGGSIIDSHTRGNRAKKAALKRSIETEALENVRAFVDEAEKYKDSKFVMPILDTVRVLPKHELANMAEALISLPPMKLRV